MHLPAHGGCITIEPAQTGTQPTQGVTDEFGYRQELRRVLRLFAVFAVAFSVISISTGTFVNFGFGISHLGPASIWLWPIAAVGQALVALVLAELATRIPLAGATALIPCVIYLLTVVAYALRRRRLGVLEGAFSLGRWDKPVFAAALVWLVVAVLALVLPAEFRPAVLVVLGGLLLAGVWYVAGLRRRLADGTAGPPVLHAAEEEVA